MPPSAHLEGHPASPADLKTEVLAWRKRMKKLLAVLNERNEEVLKLEVALRSERAVNRRLMESVDFIYCEQTSATAASFVSYHAADADMDTPSVIPAIKAPVLVIAGTEDSAVRNLPEKMEPVADGERVQLLVMDGADHFFRDLYSEDIADAVAELLGM